jgi:hypothetical protein
MRMLLRCGGSNALACSTIDEVWAVERVWNAKSLNAGDEGCTGGRSRLGMHQQPLLTFRDFNDELQSRRQDVVAEQVYDYLEEQSSLCIHFYVFTNKKRVTTMKQENLAVCAI